MQSLKSKDKVHLYFKAPSMALSLLFQISMDVIFFCFSRYTVFGLINIASFSCGTGPVMQHSNAFHWKSLM